MVAGFDMVIFAGKDERSGLAKRAIDGGENWAVGEFFPITRFGTWFFYWLAHPLGKTLVQLCLLHLFPQGLAIDPEYFRRSCSVAADA